MKNVVPPVFIRQAGSGEWRIRVHVQPGAKRDELAGLFQESLKVRLSAPAVDNKANGALVNFIASLLGLRRSQVSLVSGQTSRSKSLRIQAEVEPDWSLLV
ncbi:DUF167 domain-containing protein [Humidesulfovibrio sp.]|uniref:DUF167 domain-containing protein n=1 Tax=Humidesulfovibrio sp. TaxID=2910988 RepID=UPI00280AB3A3|nr:DUF167 domain-containing protein [Humidesulfovibrio sp.]